MINISTKTKIAFLSDKIDLTKTFWSIPIVEYHMPKCGVIKKQMKFISTSEEELQKYVK